MRQIETEMVAAIRQRRNWRKDNTSVEVFPDGDGPGQPMIQVRLHGNLIAELRNDVYIFSDAGWATVTTRSRLNALFEGLNLPLAIYQSRWNQYLSVPGDDALWFGGHFIYRLVPQVSIDEWCLQHGFTEPFYHEGRWWAYPLRMPMPVPIAYNGAY